MLKNINYKTQFYYLTPLVFTFLFFFSLTSFAENDHHKTVDTEAFSIELQCPKTLIIDHEYSTRVFLIDSNRTKVDITKLSILKSFNSTVAFVPKNTNSLTAKSIGNAMIRAEYLHGKTLLISDPVVVKTLPRNEVEARGIWVNRWAFSNPEDIEEIMERSANANFNQVYFQVRGTFNAFYKSNYEPWAQRLSGKLGKDPTWDPLQVAIDEAHKRGLELHAWINVLPLWQGKYRPKSSEPLHKYRTNPEWKMVSKIKKEHAEYVWASPAIPEVRKHNALVAFDIASRYEIDGLHLDRIRYPSKNYSYDKQSINLYTKAKSTNGDLDFFEWRRNQVTKQVEEIHDAVKSVKPDVSITAAVSGIYKDVWNWGKVTEGYSDWMQDWFVWVEKGFIDAAIPMVYWPFANKYGDLTDFRAITDHYAKSLSKNFVYIGSDLRESYDASGKTTWKLPSIEPWQKIKEQILFTRKNGIHGWVLYDYTTLEKAGYWDDIEEVFETKAEVPKSRGKQVKQKIDTEKKLADPDKIEPVNPLLK